MKDTNHARPSMIALLRRGTWPFLLALALALAGCSGSSDGNDGIVEVSAVVGPAGGTVDGPDGVRVEVPAGALSVPTTIRIARTADGAPAQVPDGYAPARAVYEITPHDLSFALPVTISMPTPAAAEAQVFTAAGPDGWDLVEAVSDGGRTSWETLSFSWFLVAVCAPRAGDPYPCYWPRVNPQLTATPSTAATQLATQNMGDTRVLRWRVTQAATLRMALAMTAARDCVDDARLTIRPYVVTNDRVVFLDPVLDQAVVMTPDPSNDSRSRQTINWDLVFARPDNGTQSYWLKFSCVREFSGSRTSISGYVRFEVDIGPLPAIAMQPADASVTEPDAATFTVVASGDPTPTLQWQRSADGGATWADLPGATTASYTTPATSIADDGSLYRVVATNSAGSAGSAAARLMVSAPLQGRWYPAAPVGTSGADAFDPSVGVDSGGRTLAVWNAIPAGSLASRTYFASATAGQPWSAPVDIGGAGFANAYGARIAVAPGGRRAAAAWGYRAGNAFRLAAATFDGSTWSAPQRLDTSLAGNTTDHRIAIDSSGRAVVVWEQYDTSNVTRVFASFSSGTAWRTPVRIDRGSPAGQLAVAVNAQGRGFAVFSDGATSAFALAAVPLDLAAGSGGVAVSVREGSRMLGARGVTVDATDAATLLWVDDSPAGYSVRYSHFAPATGWGTPADLTGEDDTLPTAENFAVTGGANGDVVVAWRHSRFGPQSEEAVVSAQRRNGAWSPLLRHSQGRYAELPRVAANANGRVALTWLQYDASADAYVTWGRIFDGGQWRPAQALQQQPRDVPVREEHALALGDGDHAAALWLERAPDSGALSLEAAFFAP